MHGHLSNFLRDESASAAIEYSLMSALIGLVIVTAAGTIGNRISLKLNTVGSALR